VPQFWRVEEDDVPAPEEAFVAIRDGIRYSGMGAWNGMLSEQQMWQLANFVSRMHHLPPDVNRAWNAYAR
jgi:cytochrome c553